MIAIRKCICCGNERVDKLSDLDFLKEKDSVLPSHYDVVCCCECGTCFADLDGNQNMYNEYYEKYNNYVYDSKVKISSIENTPYKTIAQIIMNYFDRDIKIVDIGCGGGEVLQLLYENGYRNLLGLDPSIHAVENLKSAGIDAKIGNIFNQIDASDRGAFGLVISTCVIEHIYDVNLYIDKLKQYINKTDGKLLLVAPSTDGFSKHFLYKPNYFNHEHINYFNIFSLDNILANHSMKRISQDNSYSYNGEESIYGIYEEHNDVKNIEKDDNARKSIESYLEKWESEEQKINNKINVLLNENNKIIVFGLGQLVEWIIVSYPNFIDKISFFVDNNRDKCGVEVEGKIVCSPEKICDFEDDIIVVCSMLHSEEIVK